MTIKPPSAVTLRKYGLDIRAWLALVERQGGVCAICGKLPKTGRLVIDHEHVRGWKKLPPEQRAWYVRGLLCWWDNAQTVGRGATAERLRSAARYLERYAQSEAA
jgi:hypothetical protein